VQGSVLSQHSMRLLFTFVFLFDFDFDFLFFLRQRFLVSPGSAFRHVHRLQHTRTATLRGRWIGGEHGAFVDSKGLHVGSSQPLVRHHKSNMYCVCLHVTDRSQPVQHTQPRVRYHKSNMYCVCLHVTDRSHPVKHAQPFARHHMSNVSSVCFIDRSQPLKNTCMTSGTS
jgi:hypothetical protein